MTMSNQTAAKVTPITQGNRHIEEVDGMTLEYVIRYAQIWKLFGFAESEAKSIPALNRKVPVRLYLIPGTDEAFAHPHVPTLDLMHQFDVLEVAICLDYFLKGTGFPPFFYGLHGTGKTSFFDQLHARLGLPKVEIILGEDSEVIDLGGQMLPTEKGGMKFHEGLLVQTMRNGWTLQIDEYDLLPVRQQKMLNDVLENKRFTIEVTGQKVIAHKNWRVCVCGNSNNTGTGSSMFVSSGGGDASVNERFFFFEKTYLPKDAEKRILVNVAKPYIDSNPEVRALKDEAQKKEKIEQLTKLICGTDDKNGAPLPCLIDQMLLVCERIRKAHINSRKTMSANGVSLDSVMSTRALKQWCMKTLELMSFYANAAPKLNEDIFKTALRLTFINGISEDEKQLVEQIFDDSLGGK